jgi:hypothetical protein
MHDFKGILFYLKDKSEMYLKSSPNPVKTKECPSCAMEVDAKSTSCPICQFEFPKRSPWITWMAIFLLIIWLLSYLL